ncbi:hypothetical protein AAG906_035300 [Vitis piasezkii]
MNCARPIFDQYYIPIVPCNRTDATFSSSLDLPYSCTIGSTVVTRSFMAVSEPYNLSSSDLQEKLLMGLQLSFLGSRCLECTTKDSWASEVEICTGASGVVFLREDASDQSGYSGTIATGSKWALIYDFMPNGSLDKFIFLKGEKHIPLSWDRLYKIAVGVGHGIDYLHQGCDMQILHFDIKPHNILLDEDFTPKVSDFSLAKLYSTNESVVSLSAARGTLGYIAPELFYKNIGHVSYKADVYSFGMLLMEMVGKQRHFSIHQEQDLSKLFFPSWIYDQIEQGEDMEMGDVTEDEKKYIWKMVIVALWCVQMKPMDRPSMSKALDMLDDDVELLQLPPKPTLYSHEISALDRENKPMGVQISSHNASITISLDGR